MRVVLLVLVLLLAGSSVFAKVTVLVDGKQLEVSPAPVIREGRVYVPVTVMRKLGLWVEWQPEKRHAEVAWPESDVFVDYEVGRVWMKGLAPEEPDEELPGKPFMRGGELMVPLVSITFITFTLEWNQDTSTVNVHRDQKWLQWRIKMNDGLLQAQPDKYETPV